MDVRVCGPNLNDQSKGQFHVHEASCADLWTYGPNRISMIPKGGDVNGEDEMLVEDASVLKVVVETYGDQIAEQPAEERGQYVHNLVSDFWFAPCTKGLPYG